MKISSVVLVKGTAWIGGAFAISQFLRVVSSVVMARLLAPDAFGVMVIVFSLTNGIELLTDVGFAQSVVANKNADQPNFLDTAWTLRLIRGLLLSLVSFILGVPFAKYYNIPILKIILPTVSIYFLLAGIASLTQVVWQRQLRTIRQPLFDVSIDLVATAVSILFAYLNPTVWALVFASLFPNVVRCAASYAAMPELRHRFFISREYAKQIIHFGRWIFLSSLLFFFAQNFDRLYLGRTIPLQLLGVYGIARNFPEMLNSLVGRLGYTLIFPFTSAHVEIGRHEFRSQFKILRVSFLLLAGSGVAVLATFSDVLIMVLYDHRYHDAGWMVSIMMIGAWFSMLCTMNEYTLLGLGKSVYGAAASASKFLWLLVALPFSVLNYGLIGIVFAVAFSDVTRYIPIYVGQRSEGFSFLKQDACLTLLMVLLFGSLQWLRFYFGLGTSLSDAPFFKVT